MPVLSLIALPAFEDNYIWVLAAADGRCLVIDPGDAEPVERACAEGLRPLALLLTHHHPDHIGGVERLRSRYAIPVFGPDDPRVPATDRVADGQRPAIAGWEAPIEVLDLPGHTRSHLGFLCAGHLFCGDTLFSLGCGRLFEGTPAQMLDSLDRIAALPAETTLCCAHEYTLGNAAFALAVEPGNSALRQRVAEVRALREAGRPSLPGRLDSERACNPFLRSREPSVRAAVEAHWQQDFDSNLEVFAALRRWKDGFRA